MLVLLPPSEGKTPPAAGPVLDLATLSSASLTVTRELILRTLVRLSQGNAQLAAKRLGLGPTQLAEIERNAALLHAPTSRADAIYTGVLYEAWSPDTLNPAARAYGNETVTIASALFGVVRAGDLIPAYRLSAGVTLPRIGTVAGRWRKPLGKALAQLAGDGLLLDLRSGAYINLHKPTGDLAMRTVTVRVLHEANGWRKVVSHFNKATKGHLVRAICEERLDVASPRELADALRDLGWTIEVDGDRLDVIVRA